MFVTVSEIRAFISQKQSSISENLLARCDPGRLVSLLAYEQFISSHKVAPGRVAVVSGPETEPELQLIPGSFVCDLLNYDTLPKLYDLNLDWSQPDWEHLRGSYDLVLCEQVLEHLKDPSLAVKNLALLLRPRGYLHISVPGINNRHGSDYFYAGFPPETLVHYANQNGLDVVTASSWASDKAARMYATCDWFPLASSGPIIFFLLCLVSFLRRKTSPHDFLRVLVMRTTCAIRYPFQPLLARSHSKNLVASWVVAQKPRQFP